jgi:hypothetical protein
VAGSRSRSSRSSRPPALGDRYRGQVAVVTGASAGLGAQLCRDLAQAGGPSQEISVSGLIDAAMVFRHLMPRTHDRLRRNW